MKIDSCIIVKNEEENIEHLLSQLIEFSHEVHITDTGSTDNTINIINEFVNKYDNVFLHHFEWCDDFSAARNYSLYCYENNADYFFWCDGDDDLNETLINTLKNFDGNDDIYYISYQYDKKILILRTALFKVINNFKWEFPIHEYIDINKYNDIKLNDRYFYNGSLIIHHRQDVSSPRYLYIFRNFEKNNKEFSAHDRYYYGIELLNSGLFESACYQFKKCIEIDGDDFFVAKILSCNALLKLNDNDAIKYFYKLLNQEIYRKDTFYYVGNYFYNKEKFVLARLYYIMCINIEEPNFTFSHLFYDECHISALLQLGVIEYNFGNYDECIYYNKEILKIDKDNEIAKYNLSLFDNN